MIKALRAIDRAVGIILRSVAILMFVALFLILAANVFFRWFPLLSMGWLDEIVQLCFAYMVFIAAAEIWRVRDHFKINWIEDKLKGTPSGEIVRSVVDILSLVFFIYLTRYGWQLVVRTRELTPIFQFPRRVMYAAIPFSAVIMAIYALRDVVRHAAIGLRSLHGPTSGEERPNQQ